MSVCLSVIRNVLWSVLMFKMFLFVVGYYTSTFGFMTIACIVVSPIFGYITDYFKKKFTGKL